MSFWSRVRNVVRRQRLIRDLDEELETHIAEAIERGRDPIEARRALGSALQLREESLDIRLIPWLDSLRADARLGWRHILKNKTVNAAAVLSLALAIGACVTAFRLIDALMFRPLPVAGAERLYAVAFTGVAAVDGAPTQYDSASYPMFLRMRADVSHEAEMIGVSLYNGPVDLTYASDQDMERTNLQYVSSWMFDVFELRPAIGQLFRADDDLGSGASARAVLSYDYWTRRFERDPAVVGRTFRMGAATVEIIGVAPKGFTGTDTGWTTDVFVPMRMKDRRILASLNNFWLRTLVQLKPGTVPTVVQEKLRASFAAIQAERIKGFPSQSARDRDRMLQERLSLVPASSGRSNLQRQYRQALATLGLLVALVLLITCANVANLMSAQAAAREQEMALRVSIGAGRWRLVQLTLVESAWVALLATALGLMLAWWSAPIIVAMINPASYPARLALPMDWRLLAFTAILTGAATILFGSAPAWRASMVSPIGPLRESHDPPWRRRLMRALIVVQVAFCFAVVAAAGLFVATFKRLTDQPTGFSAERVLNVEAVSNTPQSSVLWEQLAEYLRSVPGVEKVALIGWPLMSGESAVGNISIDGALPGDVFADFVTVSPGWADLMRVPLLAGRDFHPLDNYPATALVNQAFAKQYFNGENPVGRWFDRVEPAGGRSHLQVIGLVGDARSRDQLRIAIRPTAYIPFRSLDAAGTLKPIARGTFVIRSEGLNPVPLAPVLRRAVAEARPGFRVRDVRTQIELNQTDTLRERLLALLATFFAVVAMLLAAVGLYGVLDYSVMQHRREIAIRMAVGAQASHIVRRIFGEGMAMVAIGTTAGLGLALVGARYVQSLLYQVRFTDPVMMAMPALTIVVAALIASLPAVIRAIRTDPIAVLRT